MSCNCVPRPEQGNEVFWVPLKEGFPLSNACERSYQIGTIPEIIRFPNFTLVNGGVVGGKPSNGGILNAASFFKRRNRCYGGDNNSVATNCE